MDANKVLEHIRAHRSIREYTSEAVREKDIAAAIASGQAAATSSAVQPYSVIRITDMEKRARIANLCGPQDKVALAPEFFVFCADLRRHALIFEHAGKPYQQRLEAFIIALIDTSLLAQNFVLALEALAYGTCYIGGLRNNLPKIDAILALPKLVCPVYGLCVGRPAEAPTPRPRLASNAILFENTYPDDDAVLEHIDTYDEVYRNYLRSRGAKDGTWSKAILAKFANIMRPDVSAYYTSKGIRLD